LLHKSGKLAEDVAKSIGQQLKSRLDHRILSLNLFWLLKTVVLQTGAKTGAS
jgi:hypothetical protein